MYQLWSSFCKVIYQFRHFASRGICSRTIDQVFLNNHDMYVLLDLKGFEGGTLGRERLYVYVTTNWCIEHYCVMILSVWLCIHTILHHTIPHTTPHHIIPHHTTSYHTPHRTTSHHMIPHTTSHHNIPHYTTHRTTPHHTTVIQ